MGKIKKALITGITGQDGSYLSELLLKKKYKWSFRKNFKNFKRWKAKKKNS